MTVTTDTRQLRLTISAFLKARGIDNLELESEITLAARAFFEGTKQGRDPVTVREELTKSLWSGLENALPIEKMKQRIMDSLRINISDNKVWEAVLKHCVKQDEAGEPFETYAAAVRDNPYEMPKAFQIASNPNLIILTWKLAFSPAPKVEDRPEYRHLEPEEEKIYVENPYRKTR